MMEKSSRNMEINNVVREGNGIVYHYTSLDTFLKILDGVKYNHFIFHATEIFSMNDPTEFYHGFNELWSLLPQIEDNLYRTIKEKQQDYRIDECLLDNRYRLSNMWNNRGNNEEKWLNVYIKEMRQSYRFPFVVSFSCKEDFLPMWLTYGDNGNGIALGFDIQSYYTKLVKEDGSMLLDFTNYNENEQHSLLVSYDRVSLYHPLSREVCGSIIQYLRTIPKLNIDNDSLFYFQIKALDNITRYASALMKNSAYKYEKESRLLFNCQNTKELQFKISSKKKMLPYIKVGIPISKLMKIIVGPCCDFQTIKSALKTIMAQKNIHFNDENIIKSEVPYRIV